MIANCTGCGAPLGPSGPCGACGAQPNATYAEKLRDGAFRYPPICACCLQPATTKTTFEKQFGNRKYSLPVPACKSCAPIPNALLPTRAGVVIGLPLLVIFALSSQLSRGSDSAERIVAGTLLVAVVISYFVKFIPPFRRRGHVPGCESVTIDPPDIVFRNREYAKQAAKFTGP